MKKILFAFLLGLGLLSSLFAEKLDFIALATEGKFNESSLGVKALNDEEMSKVVGGAYVNGNIYYQYGIVTNFGEKIYYTAYYAVTLGYGDSLYFNLLPHEMATVATTYDFRSGQITNKPIIVNKYNPAYVRYFDFPSDIEKRISNYDAVNSWIRHDKRNISDFNPKYYK